MEKLIELIGVVASRFPRLGRFVASGKGIFLLTDPREGVALKRMCLETSLLQIVNKDESTLMRLNLEP